MRVDIKILLKSKVINGWRLFWLLCLPISFIILYTMMETDLSTGVGVSHMISYSVRWAIPFIFIIVGTSSLHILFPSVFSRWLVRNRKYLGLCFAVVMAWQGVFIFIVSTFLRDYYFKDIYLFRDELEGSVGYIFLVAMTITSFKFGRKLVSPIQWKLIHKGGVYFLWSYPFSVYWWALATSTEPRLIDYVFYCSGLFVFLLRIAAWGKKRQQWISKKSPENNTPIQFKLMGSALIILGLVGSASGFYWQEPLTTFLTSVAWSAELVLWLPFWPLEPFLPILIIALGTLFLTKLGGKI